MLTWNGPGMEQTSRTLKVDEILYLLSHSHRRTLLRTLKNHDDNLITFGEGFNALMEIEAECAGKQMEEDQYIAALVHYHGPKLREAGLVDYDIQSEEIHYYPNERVETGLEMVETLEQEV